MPEINHSKHNMPRRRGDSSRDGTLAMCPTCNQARRADPSQSFKRDLSAAVCAAPMWGAAPGSVDKDHDDHG